MPAFSNLYPNTNFTLTPSALYTPTPIFLHPISSYGCYNLNHNLELFIILLIE